MKKITFKEYIDSKKKLYEAIQISPIHKATYMVNKYCKIPLGESKDAKEYVTLKPKCKIIVEWRYEDFDAPEPLKVMFENVEDVDKTFDTFWTSDRLQKWLSRNTREEL